MLKQIVALVVSLVIAYIPGAIGNLVSPGQWYDDLDKPPFQPPGAVFPSVWIPLYLAMGVSLYLIWRSSASNTQPAYVLFGIQAVLNAAWSLVFFGMQLPWVAAVIIVSLLAVVVYSINCFRSISKWAAWLFVPYAAWVAFATYLNLGVAILN